MALCVLLHMAWHSGIGRWELGCRISRLILQCSQKIFEQNISWIWDMTHCTPKHVWKGQFFCSGLLKPLRTSPLQRRLSASMGLTYCFMWRFGGTILSTPTSFLLTRNMLTNISSIDSVPKCYPSNGAECKQHGTRLMPLVSGGVTGSTFRSVNVSAFLRYQNTHPDGKVHGANMGPIWGR